MGHRTRQANMAKNTQENKLEFRSCNEIKSVSKLSHYVLETAGSVGDVDNAVHHLLHGQH